MGTVHQIGPNKPSVDNVVATLEAAKGEAAKVGATKCLVILLKEDGNLYNHKCMNAGMVTSEMVALLEIQKQTIISEM